MLKTLKRWMFGPSAADQIEALREQVAKRALEAQLTFYDNLVDPREPLYDDVDFWQPVGPGENVPVHYDNRKQGEVVPVYLTEYGLKVIRDRSRRLAATNEFAINAHENRISYVVGKGYKYKAVRKGARLEPGRVDPLARQVQEVIDDFTARTCWGEREQESVRRCDRDGEAILRLFHGNEGKCDVRFVEPEMLRDSTGQRHRSFGVVTSPDDVEDVQGYSIVEDPAYPVPTFVEAADVHHVKLNTDSTAKRGLPTMYPVRKNLERAEKLLRNMSTLAQVQATYAVIRKHKQFSASAVSAFRQSQADFQVSHPLRPGSTSFLQGLPPGAIIDTTENTDYEFPAAHVDASALVAILQAELRAVAARLVMPEYMLTVDASNANYSSTLVAEAPSTKNFERLQAFFGRRFGDGCYTANLRMDGVLWRVVAYAVAAGRLPREALTEIELQVEAPSLTARDKDKETGRAERLNKAGVLSKETWSQWEGLDRQQEKRHIAKEQPPRQLSQPEPGQDDLSQPIDFGDGGGEGGSPFDPAGRAAEAQEACVPNKSGRGHHDDETGHPCSPNGQQPVTGRAAGHPEPKEWARGRPSKDEVVSGLADEMPDAYSQASTWQKVKALASVLYDHAFSAGYRLSLLAVDLAPDVLDTAEDIQKITYARHADVLRDQVGIGSNIAAVAISKVVSRVVVWMRNRKDGGATEAAGPPLGQAAEIMAAMFKSVWEEMGAPQLAPSKEEILGVLRQRIVRESVGESGVPSPLPIEMLPLFNAGYLPAWDDEDGQWVIGDTSLDADRREATEAGFSGEKRDSAGRKRCYDDGKIVPCAGNEDKARARKEKKDAALKAQLAKPPTLSAGIDSGKVADWARGNLPGGDSSLIPSLVGAQNGAEVHAYPTYDGGLSLQVYHPAIKDQSRTLSVKDGALVCKNNLFFLKKQHRGSGLGLKVFTDQVQALLDVGADRIETVAGKGGIMNGYYTWARMGYDAPLLGGHYFAGPGGSLARKVELFAEKQGIPAERVPALLKEIQSAKTVQDLMATEGGRAFWKARGFMTSMTFDLKPGSRSLEVHNAYRQSKGLPPLAPKDPEAAEAMRGRRAKGLTATPPAKPPEAKTEPVRQLFDHHANMRQGLEWNLQNLKDMGYEEADFMSAYQRQAERGFTGVAAVIGAMLDLRTAFANRRRAAAESQEACVPNKSGKGHHDDETGHPCSPTGPGAAGQPPKKAGASPAARPVSKARQKLAARRQLEAQRVDGPVQLVGYHTANHLATALGGIAVPGNLPQDVEVTIGGRLHGIESKAFVTTKKRPPAVKMGRLTRLEKEDWEEENDAVMHTVMVDHRERWSAHGEGTHAKLSPADMFPCFYRRGGSNGVATEPPAVRVETAEELLAIMALSDDELKAKYKGNGLRPVRLKGGPEEAEIRRRGSKR